MPRLREGNLRHSKRYQPPQPEEAAKHTAYQLEWDLPSLESQSTESPSDWDQEVSSFRLRAESSVSPLAPGSSKGPMGSGMEDMVPAASGSSQTTETLLSAQLMWAGIASFYSWGNKRTGQGETHPMEWPVLHCESSSRPGGGL